MAQCQPNEEWVSRVVTDLVIGARLKFSERGSHLLKGLPLGFAVMKIAVEILGDLSAAIEALLWFGSATVRLKERNRLKRGLGTGFACRSLEKVPSGRPQSQCRDRALTCCVPSI